MGQDQDVHLCTIICMDSDLLFDLLLAKSGLCRNALAHDTNQFYQSLIEDERKHYLCILSN